MCDTKKCCCNKTGKGVPIGIITIVVLIAVMVKVWKAFEPAVHNLAIAFAVTVAVMVIAMAVCLVLVFKREGCVSIVHLGDPRDVKVTDVTGVEAKRLAIAPSRITSLNSSRVAATPTSAPVLPDPARSAIEPSRTIPGPLVSYGLVDLYRDEERAK
jgi:hypothetical protein